MASNRSQWETLGQNIQDIIDQAINSQDYRALNQTIRQAVNTGAEAVRRAVNVVETKTEAATEKKNLPVLYGNPRGRKAKGIAKIAGGSVISCGTFAVMLMETAFGGMPILSLAGFGWGVWMICSGINAVGRMDRFQAYRKALGQKTQISLEKLARTVGKNVKFVRKEVIKMIGEGLFLEGHLDNEKTLLITSDETYRNFEQSRLALEERQRKAAAQVQKPRSVHTPQVQDVLDKGNAFIQEIRNCNDRIPGKEISDKIDRMELIVRRIFQRAEVNPEIVPDLKKMMDYYLPMTVKLLNAYAEMDAQPVQGETIEGSKREIEATLDTLNLAFEKLLDDLFADTALDVSSDISVLQTLLAQEGLTEDDFSKMKKQQNI